MNMFFFFLKMLIDGNGIKSKRGRGRGREKIFENVVLKKVKGTAETA